MDRGKRHRHAPAPLQCRVTVLAIEPVVRTTRNSDSQWDHILDPATRGRMRIQDTPQQQPSTKNNPKQWSVRRHHPPYLPVPEEVQHHTTAPLGGKFTKC
mmetsp:Transcript_75430/g.126906  ORF Transcript_75430/g.126906 Transcript_75430/m.126906 type:complete len:100 (-) Transcript_75430:315-614(-)